ncbi:unnamed protein product [Didymodactylos carnosus]|nr:unnamed protein product [Didymodactylos carnosus]CAF3903157.1 unnamed protein product [Didymodactylos carnosus]
MEDMLNRTIQKATKKLQDKLDALKDNKLAQRIWKMYKQFYRKSYTTDEEEKERFAKFIDNLKLIVRENFRFDEGVKTFKLNLNQFGDMDLPEFRSKLTGLIPSDTRLKRHIRPKRFLMDSVKKKIKKKIYQKLDEKINRTGKKKQNYNVYGGGSGGSSSSGFFSSRKIKPSPSRKIPSGSQAAVDYRSYMNPIENQGQCGSCYAFAVTAAIEGTYSVKKGSRIKMSKQQLIDCSPNNGCSGGYLGATFDYIKQRSGLQPDTSYPYATRQQTCKLSQSKVGAISSYGSIQRGDEEALKQALTNYGPVAAAIHTTSDLQFYGPGKRLNSQDILDIPGCSKQVDHAIAIVGYGTQNGKDYWIVRNSWGTNWGLDGYFKIARNKNMCGIATYGYYSVI